MADIQDILLGAWSYRSFNNDPDLGTAPADLVFGEGTFVFTDSPINEIAGTIGGPGWSLTLSGSVTQGNPWHLNFQGDGIVSGSQWIYAYNSWLVPVWPNGIKQVPAIVGSVIRVIPHPGSDGGLHPAGVVASFYAVRQD